MRLQGKTLCILTVFTLMVVLTLLLAKKNLMRFYNATEESYFKLRSSTDGINVIGHPYKEKLAKRYFKKLCELDKIRLMKLENADFKSQDSKKLVEQFHEFVMNPVNSVCDKK